MTVLTDVRKNEFVRKYDYGRGTVDLGDFVIRHTFGCPASCVYCYRADDHTRAPLKVFLNHERMIQEIQSAMDVFGEPLYFNAGENTDSLFLDHQSGVVRTLVPFFALTRSYLELRTKSKQVSGFLDLPHGGRTLVAFSLTPEEWLKRLEPGTAVLQERLFAARSCADAGYKIIFVLDPMFHLPDWRERYHKLISQIFSVFSPEEISYFSLGTFRYTKGMVRALGTNPEFKKLIYNEFVQGNDKKFRYFKPIRAGMYKDVISFIRSFSRFVPVVLSHETPSVWEICLMKPKTILEVLLDGE